MDTKTVLNSMQQGVLICNAKGRILYFNDAYGDYIGQKLEEVKGKPITDYRNQALIPKVIRTGEAVEGKIRREANQEYFASVYPILEDDRVLGTISIVTTLIQYKLKADRTNLTLEEKVRRFERQEIQDALSIYGNHMEGKRAAAKALGISLATLYNKLKE